MGPPEISDSVLGWLAVFGVCSAAVIKGAWGYLKNSATGSVKVATTGGSNGQQGSAVFDLQLVRDIRNDVRVMRRIAERDVERREREAHDRELRAQWEWEQQRGHGGDRRRSQAVLDRYERMKSRRRDDHDENGDEDDGGDSDDDRYRPRR